MKRSIRIACILGLALAGASWSQQRNIEALDRGVVAVKVSGGVFVSWRVLGTDADKIAFDVYRGTTKVNPAPITGATNLVDPNGTTDSKYSVRALVDGVEQSRSKDANTWGSQVLKIPLESPGSSYSPGDASVGDLDGDGDWDIVLKWDPSNQKDNSQSGVTSKVYLDGITLEGKRLWRIDLGVNIRAGAHYTQFLVGDYDGDGKAEVACKTAPGTKDGTGKFISMGPAANANHSQSYVNGSGYILSGPEYVTIFNGETGKELGTLNYTPQRGTVSSWGDSYGNRLDRYLATNAYLGAKGPRGLNPSMVFQRGYYTRMAIAAYDWDGKTFKERWFFDSNASGNGAAAGQGNHNLTAGDVDGDGFDEIIQGACAIDHDGKFMYSTRLGHGDAMHLGDLDPDNPGLEVWEVHENGGAAYGYELHDARTGKILWGTKTGTDNGRGMTGDIDASSRGHEMWSSAAGLYSAKGTRLSSSKPSVNFRVYWDGDLLDELLDGNKVDKWNGNGTTRVITLQGSACNGTKNTPNFSGDILGDWREEVILHDASNLYLTTTTIPTTHRVYTLAHDPVYRLAMSWQNGAYNQPPHLGYWLGAGVDKAPKPIVFPGQGAAISNSGKSASISLRRTGTNVSLALPWSEPSVAKFTTLDGRMISRTDIASGGAVELAIPSNHRGAMILSIQSATGRTANATISGL